MSAKQNARVRYIRLKPVEMTPKIMQRLEDKGLIHRLCPRHDETEVPNGETAVKTIYSSADKYGPHKLIAVTVNRSEFALFHTHPDNEELLAIGDPEAKPLYFVIALCSKEELEEKASNKTLTREDFMMLKVKYNDPAVSFFTIIKNVPHGEASTSRTGRPPSFYVAESRDLDIIKPNLKYYKLKIEED